MNSKKLSTKIISSALLERIADAIRNKDYGSVEIYIQNSEVTQITERTIFKMEDDLRPRRKVETATQKQPPAKKKSVAPGQEQGPKTVLDKTA